ncbi:sigma-70 family RNA polymerase sigma factor [Sphingobacterium olei]|uniref:Sigma-70 family RNA polymerase sigma factor n=1 Tax=Sphingobacterium olei TaxID=2571155 RepID=A0A4U0NK97_9SPHI|nr:sigma-70 family RNA polymerase sigma factor [Sphingobacterium olei]TJZ54769.1 sigma-70 family RNA polymerase sigma factor [Sphingobacterium olei]
MQINSDRAIQENEQWESLRRGDESALQTLYMSYHKHLLHYGLRYTTDRELLKDSINNTFLYLWEKRDSLSAAKHVGNYIFRSYQRRLERDLKKHKDFEGSSSTQEGNDFYESDEVSFILRQEENIRIKTLKNAILKLPKRQRELIALRYYEGLSYDEIAAKTQLTKRAVYNQIHTAINSLKANTRLQNLKHILSIIAFF